MATSVAAPLERQFGHIAGLTEMTSTSYLGSTSIALQFEALSLLTCSDLPLISAATCSATVSSWAWSATRFTAPICCFRVSKLAVRTLFARS